MGWNPPRTGGASTSSTLIPPASPARGSLTAYPSSKATPYWCTSIKQLHQHFAHQCCGNLHAVQIREPLGHDDVHSSLLWPPASPKSVRPAPPTSAVSRRLAPEFQVEAGANIILSNLALTLSESDYWKEN